MFCRQIFYITIENIESPLDAFISPRTGRDESSASFLINLMDFALIKNFRHIRYKNNLETIFSNTRKELRLWKISNECM